MKNQKGFALALVILVLLIVTTISIPLILSTDSTNRQINKVENINENQDEVNILIDLIVSKYKSIVETENLAGSVDWSSFQTTLDNEMTSFIATDLTYDSASTTININPITYAGNSDLISREVTIITGGQTVIQKVNFEASSTGSGVVEFLGITSGGDIKTDGYLDIDFDVSANNDYEVFRFTDLNLNNGVKIDNYSTNTVFKFTDGSTSDYDDLSSTNQTYVQTKINFFATDYPGNMDMHKMIYYRILTEYGEDYDAVVTAGLTDSQIFSNYLGPNSNGWRTYNGNRTIRANQLNQSTKYFVNGDININLGRNDDRTDLSGITFIATGDINVYSNYSDVYLRTPSSFTQMIAGGDIELDGAINQNGVIFNALLLAEGQISIDNSSINMSENFDFEGIIHSNTEVVIKNRDRNQGGDYMDFEENENVLVNLPGDSSNTQVIFSVNPKQ
jgi:Tfp pilus assembly major pilin PilA